MILNLVTAENATIQITLDRNDRKIEVTRQTQGKSDVIASTFFPVDVLPFAAMVIDTLLRTMLWAVLVLLVVFACEVSIVFVQELWLGKIRSREPEQGQGETVQVATDLVEGQLRRSAVTTVQICTDAASRNGSVVMPVSKIWYNLTQTIHPIGLVALLGSLCFVAWIASVQYQAEPHIYDAGAYLFAAKMYAIGHLSVPVPPAADRFPGPFMVQLAGQWHQASFLGAAALLQL